MAAAQAAVAAQQAAQAQLAANNLAAVQPQAFAARRAMGGGWGGWAKNPVLSRRSGNESIRYE